MEDTCCTTQGAKEDGGWRIEDGGCWVEEGVAHQHAIIR